MSDDLIDYSDSMAMCPTDTLRIAIIAISQLIELHAISPHANVNLNRPFYNQLDGRTLRS